MNYNNNTPWLELSMLSRLPWIRMAISQGITNIDDIHKFYEDYDKNVILEGNIFAPGGDTKNTSDVDAVAGPAFPVAEEISDAYNFIKLYINSEGFKQRFKNSKFSRYVDPITEFEMPDIKYTDNDDDSSYYIPRKKLLAVPRQQNTIVADNHLNLYYAYNRYGFADFPTLFVDTHELGHKLDHDIYGKSKNKHWYSKLYRPRNWDFSYANYYPQLSPKDRLKAVEINDHDLQRYENYADIIAFRHMLQKDGIYDSMKKDNPFTYKHLQKAKKAYKGLFIRPFRNFSDKELINIMNTVAQNDQEPVNLIYDDNNYAALGGNLFSGEKTKSLSLDNPNMHTVYTTPGGNFNSRDYPMLSLLYERMQDYDDANPLVEDSGEAFTVHNNGRLNTAIVDPTWIEHVANSAIEGGHDPYLGIALTSRESTIGNPTDGTTSSLWSEATKAKMRKLGINPDEKESYIGLPLFLAEDRRWDRTHGNYGPGLEEHSFRYNEMIGNHDHYNKQFPYYWIYDDLINNTRYGDFWQQEKWLESRYSPEDLQAVPTNSIIDALDYYNTGKYNTGWKGQYPAVQRDYNEVMLTPLITNIVDNIIQNKKSDGGNLFEGGGFFDEAYKNARNNGDKYFTWNGRIYLTKDISEKNVPTFVTGPSNMLSPVVTAVRTKLGTDQKDNNAGYTPIYDFGLYLGNGLVNQKNPDGSPVLNNSRVWRKDNTGEYLLTDNYGNIVGITLSYERAKLGSWDPYYAGSEKLLNRRLASEQHALNINNSSINADLEYKQAQRYNLLSLLVSNINNGKEQFIDGTIGLFPTSEFNHAITGGLKAIFDSDYTTDDYKRGLFGYRSDLIGGLGDLIEEDNPYMNYALNLINPSSLIATALTAESPRLQILTNKGRTGTLSVPTTPNSIYKTNSIGVSSRVPVRGGQNSGGYRFPTQITNTFNNSYQQGNLLTPVFFNLPYPAIPPMKFTPSFVMDAKASQVTPSFINYTIDMTLPSVIYKPNSPWHLSLFETGEYPAASFIPNEGADNINYETVLEDPEKVRVGLRGVEDGNTAEGSFYGHSIAEPLAYGGNLLALGDNLEDPSLEPIPLEEALNYWNTVDGTQNVLFQTENRPEVRVINPETGQVGFFDNNTLQWLTTPDASIGLNEVTITAPKDNYNKYNTGNYHDPISRSILLFGSNPDEYKYNSGQAAQSTIGLAKVGAAIPIASAGLSLLINPATAELAATAGSKIWEASQTPAGQELIKDLAISTAMGESANYGARVAGYDNMVHGLIDPIFGEGTYDDIHRDVAATFDNTGIGDEIADFGLEGVAYGIPGYAEGAINAANAGKQAIINNYKSLATRFKPANEEFSGVRNLVMVDPKDPNFVLKSSKKGYTLDELQKVLDNNELLNKYPFILEQKHLGNYEENGLLYPIFRQERITPYSRESIFDPKTKKLYPQEDIDRLQLESLQLLSDIYEQAQNVGLLLKDGRILTEDGLIKDFGELHNIGKTSDGRAVIFDGMLDNSEKLPYILRTVQDNGNITLSLPSHTKDKPRQFVLEPQGDNKFYVHMRTWDGDHIPANLTNSEKQLLFEALYNELPEGAEILFPKSNPTDYLATRGTVAGLKRLERDPRFTPGTEGTLYYADKDGSVKTFNGTSFIKNSLEQPVLLDIYELYKNPLQIIENYTSRTGRVPAELVDDNTILKDGMNVKQLYIDEQIKIKQQQNPGMTYEQAKEALDAELKEQGISIRDIEDAYGLNVTFDLPENQLFNGIYGSHELNQYRNNLTRTHEDNHLSRGHGDKTDSYSAEGFRQPENETEKYLSDNEKSSYGTEIFGILGKKVRNLTGKELKWLHDNAMEIDTPPELIRLLNMITDYDKAAKWFNKNSNIITALGVSSTLGSTLLFDKNEKDNTQK